MLIAIIIELANLGAWYHDKKSNKVPKNSNKFVYHVSMMALYTNLLEIALINSDSSLKLKKHYSKK